MRHMAAPQNVGMAMDKSVYLMLPVSFLMVIIVVEQGQCIRQKKQTLRAVITVHPFWTSRSLTAVKGPMSVSTPPPVYIITISWSTISFAGSPRMKAVSITPSRPKNLPKGSRKDVM